MMKYQIYKICCDDCDYTYIGSTKAFRQRKTDHKYHCNNTNSKAYNKKVYQKIREYGGWENWRMVCIDEIEVENRTQALIKEEEWRVTINAELNMIRAYATEEDYKEQKKEYRAKNKDKIKEYRIEHKDKIKEQKKEYRAENKDKIKEYRAKNKDKIKEQKKEYRAKNKDKLQEQKKEYRARYKEAKKIMQFLEVFI